VAGALAAAGTLPEVEVLLVGNEAAPPHWWKPARPANLAVQHASQVVRMCDSPASPCVRSDSSIAVGMKLVRDGRHRRFISAGNSGAMMAAAMLI